MKNERFLKIAAACSAILLTTLYAGSLKPENLRCEYRTNPLGIDAAKPRLSWTVSSDKRNQSQRAYRILAATSPRKLTPEKADLWDSVKVISDNTIAVEYQGKPLESGMQCCWKVKVWDSQLRPSDWSSPAHWTMGLLDPSDWQAEWIGFDDIPSRDQRKTAESIRKADWIWSRPNASRPVKTGNSFYRLKFNIPESWEIESAYCLFAADNACEIYVNGDFAAQTQSHSSLKHCSLAEMLKSGENIIAVSAENTGDSANPAGLILASEITADSGEKIELTTSEKWLCSESKSGKWKTLSYDDSKWQNAKPAGKYGSGPWGEPKVQGGSAPARYLRDEFKLADKKIKSAYLHASSLGIYEVYLNGKRIGKDWFSPGWTDYEKRVYYRTYDVAEQLRKGQNAIGGVIADGWFAGYIGFTQKRKHYGEDLRFLGQLEIEYTDGTTQTVSTSKDWKASLGAVKKADFLKGETYDARLEMPGWSKPGFDDSGWKDVSTGSDEVSPKVQAAVSEPVVVFEKVEPVSVSEPAPGRYVFDMGQNFAGVVKLRISGKRGQAVKLRHAERLNEDGTIYTANLRSADAEDTYICKGGGKEIWHPSFTFHGFQYVELTGLKQKPSLSDVTGLALSSDMPETGNFECSNPMVNKIAENAEWTMRMNFIDIPTDCPQRDERLGWTGDAQVYVNTAAYQNDIHAFFIKWLRDLNDTQREDGQYPKVAPLKDASKGEPMAWNADGGPAWADAGIICPWTIYKMYGDKRILEKYYDNMKRFIAFRINRSKDNLLPPDNFHCFGDWLNIDDNTPKDVIYTAYFARSTNLLSRIAETLGREEDAAKYSRLFEQLRRAFNKAYISSDGKIKGDSQTGYVLAISCGLVRGEIAELAAEHLVRRIKEENDHLSTGFVGTKDLMLALDNIGRSDLAYQLLLNDTFPSWGFSIKHGATTIWERWNGWTPEQGFADPGMNSFAHYSFGAVCQWIYETIGGIKTGGNAFKNIIIQPKPGGDLDWAKTSYRSIRGEIKTEWKIEGGKFILDVEIPANTSANVYLPTENIESIRQNGHKIKDAEPAQEAAVVHIGSGQYRFESSI
ncbi:family 78 glycoside hydrolase catalytic domain [Sedimentisphaera salicampi]|uniref:family 78 glycoside hydrolase catalytic domain n=1 Tax=Sedimentisphaera salicampi TaxID=1941349 RepID=UPI000B9A21F2|nr:family 78 glycoside hydrolase catalytic domain [Sedimentisphaera salicampi]OXU15095.1 Bacterial alpha-L-rhamnosidase [Sedimentisphaera salicampi]